MKHTYYLPPTPHTQTPPPQYLWNDSDQQFEFLEKIELSWLCDMSLKTTKPLVNICDMIKLDQSFVGNIDFKI